MKKPAFKRLTALLCILLMLCFIISACGAPEDNKTDSEQQEQVEDQTSETEQSEDSDVTLTVATVNNPDMIIMEQLSEKFTQETGIEVQFVVLPENELRQKVTEDVGLGAGKYDIVTIGTYDTPFWGENGWVVSLEPFFDKMPEDKKAEYDREDLFKPICQALSYDGEQYALPFYGESSIVFYRKDLFEQKGLTMPEQPTWDEIYELAIQLHDPANGIIGMVLRGLPGWGQNMAPFGTMINAFGARWFDMDWNPQFETEEMKSAFEFYKKIQDDAGQPGATTAGYTECLALMSSGKGAIWYDASVAGGALEGEDSQVKGKIGYAMAPKNKKSNTGWLWAWSLAIEAASKHKDQAFEFITWATSKEYVKLVAEEVGWAQVPPGTRKSTYDNPEYLEAAPFAEITLKSIENADYDPPTVDEVPYKGSFYVSIPEYQNMGEQVSQQLAAYLADKQDIDTTLKNCQDIVLEVAKEGGYLK